MSSFFSISELVDSGGNFISIYIDKDEVDNIALKVIEYDRPNHILPFAVIYNKDEILVKYNFSNTEKLEMIDEDMSTKDFIEVLSKLCNLLCNCKYWFLESEKFLFDKKYVFYDNIDKQLQLIYIPIKEIENSSGLKDLLLYIIEKINIVEGDKLKIHLLQEMVKPSFNPYKLQKVLQSQLKMSTEENIIEDNKKGKKQKKVKKKNSFFSWLFQSDPVVVSESIDLYQENIKESKYYLHLKNNDTRFKLSKKITLDFFDDTFLVGRSKKGEEQSLLKYSLNEKVKEVDPLHLKFVKKDKGIFLVDLESSLGTYVNGDKIPPRKSVEVSIGDKIALSPKVIYELKANS